MSVEPGNTCPTCERRVNYPRKADSPKSRVKSLRIPEDDATFDEDFARFMLILGITTKHKYGPHKALRFLMDTVFVDEAEWSGAYTREWEAA